MIQDTFTCVGILIPRFRSFDRISKYVDSCRDKIMEYF